MKIKYLEVVKATTAVVDMGDCLIFATQITARQRICKGEDRGGEPVLVSKQPYTK